MARLATVIFLLACTLPLLAAAESDIEWAALEFDQEAEQAVATRGRDLLEKKYGIAAIPGAYPSPPPSPSPTASPSPSPAKSPSPSPAASPAASPSPSAPVPTPPGIVRSNTLTMTFLIVTTQGCTDALKNGWRTAIAASLNVDPSVITMDCATAAGGRRLSAINVNMKGTGRFNSELALEAAKKAASAASFPNIVEHNLSGTAATQTMDVKKLTVTSCTNCAVPARLPSAPIPVGKRSFKSKCNTKKPKTCTATFNYRRSNGATGYRVECTINKGKKPFKKVPAKSIKIALGVTLKFTLQNLAPNTPFTCMVSAFNSIGSSGKRAFNFRSAN